MATTPRIAKTGSNLTFVAEVAGGNTTILASEVDADFDAIFGDYNGNIDSNNLATDAVVTDAITDLNVTTGKLASEAVTTGKLATDAITTVKITDANVTTAKLAIGATVNSSDEATTETPNSITSVSGETQWETATLTSRGGTILILATAGGYVTAPLASGSVQFTLRLKRGFGGTLLRTIDGEALGSHSGATADRFPWSVTFALLDAPGAGSVAYEVTAEITTANATLQRADISIVLVDLA